MTQILFGKVAPNRQALAVIMAGGSGTRFWPLSRQSKPKQFVALGSDSRSLIQLTADRAGTVVGTEGVVVVTAGAQRELVAAHLPDAAIIAEPIPRNTAPCLALAASVILNEVGDVPLLCLPADHKMYGEQEIARTYNFALQLAKERDVLVTIGIRPEGPETGYGYISAGAEVSESNGKQAYRVERFVEKPNRTQAEEYLAAGTYYWNSGMFAWRPSVLLKAVSAHLPNVASALEEMKASPEESGRIFGGITPISVDVGVMERADNVVMVGGEGFSWSDVGSWSSWAESIRAEQNIENGGNLIKGDGVLVESTNAAVYATTRFVAGVGLENIIIVETEDAVLVCSADKAQDVRKVVEGLQKSSRTELL